MSLRINATPLHQLPSELQLPVLELLDARDVAHLQLTSHADKELVDSHKHALQLHFKKKELACLGRQLKEEIDQHHMELKRSYEVLCNKRCEAGLPDPIDDKIIRTFHRFQEACQTLLPEASLPSIRSDSYDLLFKIKDAHPSFKTSKENFVESYIKACGIQINTYELIDVAKVANFYNGEMIARIYNSTLMSEYIQKVFDQQKWALPPPPSLSPVTPVRASSSLWKWSCLIS